MATEGGSLWDGSQCIAAANYNNPSTKLYGPLGSGQFLCVYLSAARTLTVQTATGGTVYGILQNTPDINQACDVCRVGVTKAVAGASFSAGVPLMVDSNGRVIAWTAGSGYYQIGVSIEAAGAADDVVTVALYGAPIKVLT